MSSSAIDRLARTALRGNTPAWVPRSEQMTMHQGTVGAVDPFKGVVDFQFNDPSGLIIPGVRFLQAYSASNLPAEGHTVWAGHFGTDLVVLGQHIVPPNLVIP